MRESEFKRTYALGLIYNEEHVSFNGFVLWNWRTRKLTARPVATMPNLTWTKSVSEWLRSNKGTGREVK